MDPARQQKNERTKGRNAARKRFREDRAEHRGKKLKRWPLDVFLQ